MRNTDYFKGKKVIIAGLARSGLACANLLHDLGAQVSITDNQDSDATRLNASKLKSKEIKVELGRHQREFLKGNQLLVISPGVPDEALPVVWAKESGMPVISEIELSWMLCPATIIAVTGSNGKTTVTTLIGRILEAAGRKVFTCGNIGNPFAGEVGKMDGSDYVSLEVSSFQLENIKDFKPKVAVILNFSPNHLDRYKDMREYYEAKKRIFMNQDKTDYLVLNYDDPELKKMAEDARCVIKPFSKEKGLNPNQSAVLEVGAILGVDKKIILDVFKDFKGIEHRMEQVAEINKVKFINDSKSTTVDSAIWALGNIESPVVMIAGGKHKGVDYAVIRDLAREKVRQLVLIGEAREKIKLALGEALPTQEAASLEEAVFEAYKKAKPGDYVLFSPMCSSFDMFSNYEERGRAFKKAVNELARKEGVK